MRAGDGLRKVVPVLVERHLTGPQARRRVAEVVRDQLQDLIRSGQGSPIFMRTVDGRRNAAEETVKLQGGTISYLFNILSTASIFALEKVAARSPVRAGTYKSSWVVLVDGKPWAEDLRRIPGGSTVWITNTQPYHRKINQAGQVTKVPPYIVQDVSQQLKRRFPDLQVYVDYLIIPGGYVLKTFGWDSGLSYRTRKNQRKNGGELGWYRRFPKPKLNGRRDRAPGARMTYPTIVITE